jgi:signal peptidase
VNKNFKWLEIGLLGILLGLFGLLRSARVFVVVSGSMEPVIATGSLVIISKVDPNNIKVTDIVAFQSPADPKQTIVHRVVKKIADQPLQLLTKGDANKSADSWNIYGEGIIGRYRASVPYLGYLIAWTKTPVGFGFVIVIPALIILALEIIKIKKIIADEVDKKVQEKMELIKKTTLTLLIALGLSLSQISPIQALFSDQVVIKGISISTKNNFGHGRKCQVRHDRRHHKIIIKCQKKPSRHYEYEIKYKCHGIHKGVWGKLEQDKEIFLGTCSGTGCLEDEVDSESKIITNIDGEEYVVESD